MSLIIIFAFLSALTSLIWRIIIPRWPFRISNWFKQVFTASVASLIVWFLFVYQWGPRPNNDVHFYSDALCGVFIHGCAFWCNFWICNFAGGFRIQMQIYLSKQNQPITLNQWMEIFGGMGMKIFFQDRLNFVLVPWRILQVEAGNAQLLPVIGRFFGIAMKILKIIFPGVRGENCT